VVVAVIPMLVATVLMATVLMATVLMATVVVATVVVIPGPAVTVAVIPVLMDAVDVPRPDEVVLVVVVGHGQPRCSIYRPRYPYISTYAKMRTCSNSSRVAPVRSPAAQRYNDHPDVLSPEQVSAAVQSFTLLADPTRVRMLWALRGEDLDVASLAAAADCRPTVASQHLAKLRFAGLVEATRDGRRMVYRLRGGHVRSLLTEALFQADHQVRSAPIHD
jgi:DNA-binding transcriptional ArsR family regulator